jgi:hypothetical protein
VHNQRTVAVATAGKRQESVQLLDPMHITITVERRQDHDQSQAVVNTVAHSLDASLSFDDMVLLARTSEPIRDAFEQRNRRHAAEEARRRETGAYGDEAVDVLPSVNANDRYGPQNENSEKEAGRPANHAPRVVDGRMPVQRNGQSEKIPFTNSGKADLDAPGIVHMASTELISPTHEDHFGNKASNPKAFEDGSEKSSVAGSPYETDWYAHHFGGGSDDGTDSTAAGLKDANQSTSAASTSSVRTSNANTHVKEKGASRHELAQEQWHLRFQEQQHQRREQQRRQQERRLLRRQKRHGAFSLSWSFVCENGAMLEVIDDRVAQQALPLFKLQVNALDVLGNASVAGDEVRLGSPPSTTNDAISLNPCARTRTLRGIGTCDEAWSTSILFALCSISTRFNLLGTCSPRSRSTRPCKSSALRVGAMYKLPSRPRPFILR